MITFLSVYFTLSLILTAVAMYYTMVCPLEVIEKWSDNPSVKDIVMALEGFRMGMEVTIIPSLVLLGALLLLSPIMLIVGIFGGVKVTHE